MYLGDFRLGDTLDFKFCTTSASTGAPTQLAGSPVISAYPGNSTTQLTAGITLTVDFDTVTGLNNVRVVATSGNGYATATNYALVITTGTVGGTSAVGYCVGHFSIEARSALMPTTAARTLDVSAGGEAGIDWANIGSPTTAVNLSGTNIDVDQVVASVSGAVGSVTGAVGSVTGNVGGNVVGSVGTVNALAANVITAAATAADFTTEIQTGLATAAALATAQTSIDDLPTNAELATALDALPTAGENADAVWDEAIAGHLGAGSTGLALSSASAPTAEQNADALLGRNVAGGSNGGRMVKEALYVLRNKTAIATNTLSVYEPDDTTVAFTASVTTAAGNPIASIDPA